MYDPRLCLFYVVVSDVFDCYFSFPLCLVATTTMLFLFLF